jgi:hypothetical protein
MKGSASFWKGRGITYENENPKEPHLCRIARMDLSWKTTRLLAAGLVQQ